MPQFFDAFISYGRADSLEFGKKLYSRMQEKGLKIWFDQNDIPLGVDFQNQIDDGIEKAHNFLYIIAPHSVNSPYCGKEIELALRRHKRIIPLLHVEQIDRTIWQKRRPQGTDEEWAAYQTKGLHSSFNNMHPEIGKINWVYFREGIDDFEKALDGLLNLMQRQASYVEEHTYLLSRALEWERGQKPIRHLLVGEEKQKAIDWLKLRFKNEQAPCTPADLHCEYITESIKNGDNLMTQVLICYAQEDKETMERIRHLLRRESFTVWTNTTDIQIGEEFNEAIDRGITQADNIVYLLSPESVRSSYCLQEIALATSLNKRIIPILLRQVDLSAVPSVIQTLQYIDLTDNKSLNDLQEDDSNLLRILHQDAAYHHEHKMLLTKALKWKRQNQNPSILLRGYNLRSAEAWLKVAKNRTAHPPIGLQEEFINESLRQPPAESLDVFISYSRSDSDLARWLNERLQMQGKTTWFDQESIASGSDFQQEIYRGIETSENIVFILSPNSVNSPYCGDEVEYAASLNKRFVTVLHRAVNTADLHPVLAKVQWIDFNQNNGDFNANLNQLVRTLETDREHLHNHTKWSQRALEWEHKNKNNDLLLRGSELAVADAWLQQTQAQKKQPTPTALQQAYIAKSLKYKRKNRLLLTTAAVGAISILSVATVASVIFGLQAHKAQQEAEKQTKIVKLEKQAARAQALANSSPLDALLLAIYVTGESHNAPSEEEQKTFAVAQARLRDAIDTAGKRNVLPQQSAGVNAVVVSPDGKTLFTGGGDGTIRRWETLSGKPIGQPIRLPLTQRGIAALTLTPDGKTLVSGTYEGFLHFWTASGKAIGKPIKAHENGVISVAFSPDGQTLVSGGWDGTIRLWDATGKPLMTALSGHENGVSSVAFSPDGQTLVSGGWDGTIRLWDATGKPRMTPLSGHKNRVISVAFSPDGQTFASVGDDGMLHLWDATGKTLMTSIKAHDGERITAVAFSPDGQKIVTGSTDETLRLWDRQGNSLLDKPLRGHTNTLSSATFTPDGKTLVSSDFEGTIILWDLDYFMARAMTKRDEEVISSAVSRDGKTLVIASNDNTLRLLDARSGKPIAPPLTGHTDSIRAVEFSPDSKTLVSGSVDKTLRLWDARSGKPIAPPLTGHTDSITTVEFSPDSKTLVSGSDDKTLRLWDARSGKPIAPPLTGHTDSITTAAFSPDSKTLVSGSYDKTLRLWDASSGKPIAPPLSGHTDFIYTVEFSPDGKSLASGDWDGTIRRWDLSGKQLGQPLEGHKSAIYALAFSPDGKWLVSGSQDRTLRLWDVQSGEPIGNPFKGHKESVNSVAFSPDGKTIVSGSADNTIRLWDTTGQPIGQALEGHTQSVSSVTFRPDGQTIISKSYDGTVLHWQVGNWRQWLESACNRLIAHPALVTPEIELDKDPDMRDVAQGAGRTCQQLAWDNPEKAQFFSNRAWELAGKGKFTEAMAAFQQARTDSPNFEIPSEKEVRWWTAQALVKQGEELAYKSQITQAIELFQQAQALKPDWKISPRSWNRLCGYGSWSGEAQKVMGACDEAVALAPLNAEMRESRAIARALAGDFPGAVADFQALVKWSQSDEYKKGPQRAIEALKNRKNPITWDEINKLLYQ